MGLEANSPVVKNACVQVLTPPLGSCLRTSAMWGLIWKLRVGMTTILS